MNTVVAAIESLRPRAQWSLVGETYAGLEWLDQNQTKPTEKEITDEIARLTAVKEAEDTRQEAIKADTGLKDILAKFRSMSPSDFASYIENNVINLASAKTVLVRMGLMLMLLDRKTGNGGSD